MSYPTTCEACWADVAVETEEEQYAPQLCDDCRARDDYERMRYERARDQEDHA